MDLRKKICFLLNIEWKVCLFPCYRLRDSNLVSTKNWQAFSLILDNRYGLGYNVLNIKFGGSKKSLIFRNI